ncbi:MAG: HAMP domain-containing histidine kinase [Verrucomicrobia bacterium]|nr:HAMP domain-containing histidine kinase [Verrucomicrobiota bacterium]
MNSTRPAQRPAFFWQAALILLPVIALATVGLISLRQDRILAELEARERAQVIADDVSQKVFDALQLAETAAFPTNVSLADLSRDSDNAVIFKTAPNGELLLPPSIVELPTPASLDVNSLNPEQARLWQAGRDAEFNGGNSATATDAYEKFLAVTPPEPFAASAIFSLGLLLGPNQSEAAIALFERIVTEHPDAAGESGLALAPLARLKEFQITLANTNRVLVDSSAALATFCSNLVFHPTPLTEHLLAKTPRIETTLGLTGIVSPYRWIWETHQRARRLHAAARPSLLGIGSASSTITGLMSDPQFASATASNQTSSAVPVPGRRNGPRRFWFGVPAETSSNSTNVFAQARAALNTNEYWLAEVHSFEAPVLWIKCRSESAVREQVEMTVVSVFNVPSYFEIEVALAGRNLTDPYQLRVWRRASYFGRGGGGTRQEFLDANTAAAAVLATSRKLVDNEEILSVNVRLTSPDALFARQRARTFWFGSVIALAALAALIGLVAAWRAFVRQQRLNEMKSNFVSSVSHELRAPIASVRLLAEGLDSGRVREPAKQNEYFRFIVQECRRLSSLIENVLDFSRIEQGRKEYEFEPTDVTALVASTVKLMEAYASERQVRLTVEHLATESADVTVQATLDGRAIQQALVNLIDNALKHSSVGTTVTIGLSVIANESPAPVNSAATSIGQSIFGSRPSTFLLWVEDRGPGIPAEDHERIFERFYRRGSELRRETQGVGLGLAIVKHIAEAHGGRVVVRSAMGEGSRFTLELPLSGDATAAGSNQTNQQ